MKNHYYFMRKGEKNQKEGGKKDTLHVAYFHFLLLKEIETCAAEATVPLSVTK